MSSYSRCYVWYGISTVGFGSVCVYIVVVWIVHLHLLLLLLLLECEVVDGWVGGWKIP